MSDVEKANYINHAEASYKHAIALQRDYLKPRIGLAKLYHYKKDYDEALKQYIEAERLCDVDSSLYEGLADLYLSMKELEKAVNFYRFAGNSLKNEFRTGTKFNLSFSHIYKQKSQDQIIKRDIIWEVSKPIIFSAKVLDRGFAERRIHEIYYGAIQLAFAIDFHIGNYEINELEIVKADT